MLEEVGKSDPGMGQRTVVIIFINFSFGTLYQYVAQAGLRSQLSQYTSVLVCTTILGYEHI